MFVAGALLLNLFQYLSASAVWHVFYRRKEKQDHPEDDDISHSLWLDRPLLGVFISKILCTLACYFVIVKFLAKTLIHS